jgi:hypothetical protein
MFAHLLTPEWFTKDVRDVSRNVFPYGGREPCVRTNTDPDPHGTIKDYPSYISAADEASGSTTGTQGLAYSLIP